jgi:hypothetical protein
MAEFSQIVATLRAQERELEAQLARVRAARSALETVEAGVPAASRTRKRGAGRARAAASSGKRRTFSAATRAKMAAAQQARWAKKRAEQKK